jgi:hypothetical protein
MNILIIGEFSAFAKNLKEGLEYYGHNVVHFHDGDSWKRIISENNNTFVYSSHLNPIKLGGFSLKCLWRLNGCIENLRLKHKLTKYRGFFDIIWLVNPVFIKECYRIDLPLFTFCDVRNVLNETGRVFLSACGGDLPLCLNRNKLPKLYQPTLKNSRAKTKRGIKKFDRLSKIITGVIPVMYEYADSYRNYSFISPVRIFDTIPLPLEINPRYEKNIISGKIKILYGINRESKGNSYIIEALDILEKQYSDVVEVNIVNHVPFYEYLNLVDETNILIDQCMSYSYGMNAIIGLSKGKVVFSGNEVECQKEFEVDDIPIINIGPNVDYIVTQISSLLENPSLINKISLQSREFAINFHNCNRIAKKYIEIFNRPYE